MGRYYKTANPQNIDFMYKLPEQYMLAAVQQASQDITQNQAVMYDLYGKLQLNALSKDKERAKQILDGYETAINEIAADLQSDPLSFRTKGGDLLGLSRQMHKDFTKGEAAAIQSNYNIDAEWQKAYDKLAREGKLENANWIQALRARNLEKYKGVGYNESTGNYNTYSPEELVSYVDIDKELAEKVKEIEKQINATAGAKVEGNFIRESGKTTEKRTKDDILKVAMEEFYSDPKIQAFIKQGSDIGMLSGYYNKDENGNLTKQISPFKTDDKGNYLTDKQGNLVENPESAALSKFKSMITRFEVNNVTEAHNRLKNLPVAGTGSTRNTGDPLPAIIDGKQVINPIGYVGTSTTPTKDIESKVVDLTSSVNNKKILQNGFSHIQNDLNNGYFDGDENAQKTIATIGKYVTDNNVDELDKLLKTMPDSGWVRNMKTAVKTVKDNKIQAQNMQAQVDAYKQLAITLNNANGTNVTADDLMKQVTEITQAVVEHRGEYYDFRPEHQDKFNKVAKEVEKLTDEAYKQGNSMIIWTEEDGKSTIREVTNDEFNNLFKTTEVDKRSKPGVTGGSAETTGIKKRPTSLSDINGGSGSSGLNPTSKVGDDIQMIQGKVSYIFTDKDGKKYTKTLTQPFTRKLNTADGKKVTIIYPKERVNSTDLDDLDAIYRAKNEVELKTTDINNMVLGIKLISEANGIDFDVPVPFKLNDNTIFTPNVGMGMGTYKVNGKVALEDEDIYQEYEKTMD